MSDEKVSPRDVAGQDVARLIEARADVAACERLIELLDVKEPLQRSYAEALALTGARLDEHRVSLREAVVKNSAELTETGDAGVALDAALRARLATCCSRAKSRSPNARAQNPRAAGCRRATLDSPSTSARAPPCRAQRAE